MELEEAIRRVLSFQTEYVDRTVVDEEELEETDLNNYAINMVTYTLETIIPRAVIEEKIEPRAVIEEKIEELKILAEKSDDETLTACELDIRKNQIYLLQNILNKGESDED